MLSTGKIIGGKHIILFGDSDPIVSFLSPYHPEFLRRLFGEIDFRMLLEILPVIFASIMILKFRRGLGLGLQLGFVTLSIMAGFISSSFATISDINVITDLEIQSPHYDFNYSSLPIRLLKEGYSVTINQKSKSKIEVRVISGSKVINSLNGQTTIVFMYPGTKVLSNGIKIRANDLPLGNFKDTLKRKAIIVKDARNIFINGIKTHSSIFEQDNFIFVASGNPQKNIDLITAILERKPLKKIEFVQSPL